MFSEYACNIRFERCNNLTVRNACRELFFIHQHKRYALKLGISLQLNKLACYSFECSLRFAAWSEVLTDQGSTKYCTCCQIKVAMK